MHTDKYIHFKRNDPKTMKVLKENPFCHKANTCDYMRFMSHACFIGVEDSTKRGGV